MKPRTRLLLFVLVPLVVAIGGIAWVLQRQFAMADPLRRPLPATTQVVSARTALAWGQPGIVRWGTVGLSEPGRWFGTVLQNGNRFSGADVVAGDLKSGRMTFGANLRSPVIGPAVATGGMLFAPTGQSDVTAIDLMTGRPVWTATVGTGEARLAVDGGRVVACTADRVACFEADGGRTVWTLKAAGITAGPGLAGPYACFATADALHVLDAGTGRELRAAPIAALSGQIVVSGDRAYAFARGTGPRSVRLCAVDLARGEVAWQWTEQIPGSAMSEALWNGVHGPAVGDGIVAFAIEDRLCTLDAATGGRRWSWQAEPDEGGGATAGALRSFWELVRTPVIYRGVVYANWHGDRVSGWDVATGREVWRYAVDPADRPGPKRLAERQIPCAAPPVITGNGLLLCMTSDGLSALRCDLLPKAVAPAATPAARVVTVPVAVGAASTALLAVIILGVLGLWRLMTAATCGLLCALTLWAWACSYGGEDFVGYQTVARTNPFTAELRRGITSRGGTLALGTWRRVGYQVGTAGPITTGGRSDWRWAREPAVIDAEQARAALLRFAWVRHSRPSGISSLGPQSETSFALPHWVVAAIFAIAPLAWLSGVWRDRRRFAAGLCPWCGYDLRESKGRCPECGRAIAAARKT
jgi:outer membrane protein assembly factor BamB